MQCSLLQGMHAKLARHMHARPKAKAHATRQAKAKHNKPSKQRKAWHLGHGMAWHALQHACMQCIVPQLRRRQHAGKASKRGKCHASHAAAQAKALP
ncbi:hypothetical protein GBA52_024584 [Prunus armeniaca]|nr:hypothetical protein GBA52_024584 [Prunus armeniaca]